MNSNQSGNIPLAQLLGSVNNTEVTEYRSDEMIVDSIDETEVFKYNSNLVLKNMNKKSNSDVWKYFGILYQKEPVKSLRAGKLYCRPCFKEQKFKCYADTTSATNLRQHLHSEHRIEIKKQGEDNRQRKLSDALFGNVVTKSIPNPKDKSFIFNRRIVLWVCRDLIPFSIVSNNGFQDFWKSVNSDKGLAKLPTTATIRCEALNDVYKCIKEKVISVLENSPDNVHMTFDAWTDNHKKLSYITYTYHFIDKKWNICSTVLKTSYFPHPHKSTDLANDFKEMKKEFGIEKKRITAVTDGGSNIKKCTELLGIERIGCVAHSCNRLIQHDLLQCQDIEVKPLKDVIIKVKKIQRALTYKYEELKRIHEKDQHNKILLMIEELCELDQICEADDRYGEYIDPLDEAAAGASFGGLKSRSSVRWCCTEKLAKCYIENQSTIKKCLEKNSMYDLILNNQENQLVGGLLELLEVFSVFTRYVQGDKYPTVNILPIFYSEIESRLNTIILMTPDENIQRAAVILLANLDKRMGLNEVVIAAAILDPTMQNLSVVNEWLIKNGMTREDIIQRVIEKFQITLPVQSIDGNRREQTTTNGILSTLISKHVQHSAGSSTVLTELKKFQEISFEKDDVMEFWRTREHIFPNLASVARILMALPMTTAKSEGSFSISGCLLRDKRATITPCRAEKILFIHDNFAFAN